MTDFSDTTVLVTGATAGIGAAVARRFAAAGARLVIVGRRADRLDALAKALDTPVHPLALDVSDREAVAEAIASLPPRFAEIGVLVNNAGLAQGLSGAQDADIDDWERMIDTNVKGLAYMTRAVLPGMVSRDAGHVVNIGSVAGSYPYPGGNVYGGTKAFVAQFTLNLRSDLLGTRVRATCVEPGMTETEFSLVRFKGDVARSEQIYAGADPMSAADLAEVVHMVCALPARVNVNRLEVMPVTQAFSPFAVHRET